MIVNSTELQNNFGKYLMMAAYEDIVITRNGTEIARLTTKQQENQINWVHERMPIEGYGQKATYDEFLRLRSETEERYEYIDGEIYLLSSPKTAHQYAVTRLIALFHNFFEGTDCTPFVAPYDIELMKPSGEMNMVQPDLMVICDLDEHLGADDYYKGVPSLVVEVLSKSTRKKDLLIKADLYRQTGVQEYWIVNPENRQIIIYQFEDQDIKEMVSFSSEDTAKSFIFDELEIELRGLFKK
ncbi:type II toxin-antitoxin system prevent-host-death family antitoxin [Allobacillus sp. GCM10007491]|uniref:Type II toxin-antitoxin system Phd/YefM family antitoxin n=2 Tax=Allobacillus TaxID=1400133 RepID=A0A941HUG4_9BACI|nr:MULTISPECIES: type II toxin-antitoxin system prevent-host-death family antitoxin [Allobacillus]MBR7554902.1 type II toxin-antitoxin system Phd/YefM family antitoxin [Allobacillus saliphilus]TSJ61264.1 type II toxin-antitoxin system Phd/YefM family antitoxin [Allobacillus salarius]